MTNPDLPAKFGNDAVLSAVTPGGLPYPVSGDPANQGANAIKALALALDTAFAGPWVTVPLNSGFTGALLVRIEGGTAALHGTITGTFTGNPIMAVLPAGYRPVFPTDTGRTFAQFLVPNMNAGIGTVGIRVSTNGNIQIVNLDPTAPGLDFTGVRYPIR